MLMTYLNMEWAIMIYSDFSLSLINSFNSHLLRVLPRLDAISEPDPSCGHALHGVVETGHKH